MLIVVKFENRGVLLYAKPIKLGNLVWNPNLAQNPEKYTHGANNERMARERERERERESSEWSKEKNA